MSSEEQILRAARGAEVAGDRDRARALYRDALASPGTVGAAAVGLARLDLEAGRPDEVISGLDKVRHDRVPPEQLAEYFLLRAAAVLYRDVLKISPPPEFRQPGHREALEHAQRLVDQYAEALEATLLEAIKDLPGLSQRWRESVSIVSGRTRPYLSQSNQVAVPRLPAQPFFRREMFEWVARFEQYTDVIRDEMLAALGDAGDEFKPYVQYQPGEPVNQWAELNNSRQWTSFHLYQGGKPVAANLARCPGTAEALRLIDAVHLAGTCPNAMFSVLAPKAHIPPHHGESNARLVAHLPLVVPDGCLFRVGYDARRWQEGEVIIFDDTIEHEAWNDSDQLRVVLIFDVWNPLLSLEERAIVQRIAAAERQFRLGAEAG
ncbi:MAG: aspartyl/asparaginyl beta-hydroxylase domain-containing protein [Gammaproteobacteria bacterium]|nr:aspartyl/asparaginyl beta-hydroxylase domain-containing protein [Gammaproteobacteria bacterium]